MSSQKEYHHCMAELAASTRSYTCGSNWSVFVRTNVVISLTTEAEDRHFDAYVWQLRNFVAVMIGPAFKRARMIQESHKIKASSSIGCLRCARKQTIGSAINGM